MLKNIYAIYDAATEVYNQPIYARSEKELVRDCIKVLQDNDTQIAQSPEDFTLFRLGKYDDNTAHHILEKTPVKVHTFLELKNMIEENQNAKEPNTPIQ